MDETQPQTTKPISDDQELAKVLAGVSADSNNLDFEETPVINQSENIEAKPADVPQNPVVGYNPPAAVMPSGDADDLNGIKKDALAELRPLVDKLDLEPEEKFDIYLLLLRSTDDKTLIAPAHLAAKNITDESKRAQALLDVIKEIDFLSSPISTTV